MAPSGGLWAGTEAGVPLRRVGWLPWAQVDGLAMAVDRQHQSPPCHYGRLSGKIDLHWMTEKFLVRARPIPFLSLLD